MNNILDRLFAFMAHEKLNPNKITVQANLSVGLIGKAKKTNAGLNSDSIEKILHAYPNLSAHWLLTGEGNMLRTDEPTTLVIEPPKHPNLTDALALLKAKDEQIDRLLGLLDKALSK